jgi:hypothetical protein
MCSFGGVMFECDFVTPLAYLLAPAARRGRDALRDKTSRVFRSKSQAAAAVRTPEPRREPVEGIPLQFLTDKRVDPVLGSPRM